MSRIADEIASRIAGGIPSANPWQSVGDAVAGTAGRVVYYLSGAAVAGFAQSLVGAPPEEGLLTASPTSATPANLVQAAMDINVPGLGVWPEHQMLLHLWTDAPFLPAGERYGVLATLLQVDADGATVATIGQHVEEGDPYYTGDYSEPSVRHSVLEIDVPQMVGSGLRLAVLLQAWTSSADPVLVELYIGGGWASCIETSLLMAAEGKGSAADDHEVKASPTDTGHGSLQVKLRDSTGAQLSTEIIDGVEVLVLPESSGTGTETIFDSPDDSISITPDGEIDGGGGDSEAGTVRKTTIMMYG